MVAEKEMTFSDVQEMQKAREHNEQISERYKRLQSEIDNQFSRNYTAPSYAPQARVQYAPVQQRESALQQRPQVTEFVREEIVNTAVFTTDKFERAQNVMMPAQIQQPVMMQEVAAVQEESYALSSFAKMVMAGFTALVVGMLTLACINTKIIQNKNLRLQDLETQKQELIERNAEIQRNIERATSEDVIREYAEANGMIKVGE